MKNLEEKIGILLNSCIFDVTRLLEQITANFATFKNDVKDKIFELLVWEVNYGFGTYQFKDFAEWVWATINELGFKTVERIIDWFNTEERQEDLAIVILDTPELADALGYNKSIEEVGELDYSAVAKAGLLVYAAYIHESYIETSSWARTTWEWVFDDIIPKPAGYSLVDLVQDALTFLAAAVNAVKELGEKVWNGIKAAGEYIAKAVVGAIFDAVIFASVKFLHALGTLIREFVPELEVTTLSGGLKIDNLAIKFYREDLNLIIELNSTKINLGNVFVSKDIHVETLALNSAAYSLTFDTLSVLVSVAIAAAAKANRPDIIQATVSINTIAMLLLFATAIILILTPSAGSHDERIRFRDGLLLFFITAAATSLLNSVNLYKGQKDPTNLLVRNEIMRLISKVFGWTGLIGSGLAAMFNGDEDALWAFLLAFAAYRLSKKLSSDKKEAVLALNQVSLTNFKLYTAMIFLFLVIPIPED